MKKASILWKTAADHDYRTIGTVRLNSIGFVSMDRIVRAIQDGLRQPNIVLAPGDTLMIGEEFEA